MSEQADRENVDGEGSYFFGGLVILVMGAVFSLAGWGAFLEDGIGVGLILGAIIGFPLLLLGIYISVLGAAKIDR